MSIRVPDPNGFRHAYIKGRHAAEQSRVVLVSVHTGDVKETISYHNTWYNAKQRADALNAKQASAVRINVVETDLFAGEPNFGWKREHDFWLPQGHATRLGILRHARQVAGWKGVRAKLSGDSTHGFELRADCTILFINPKWG